MKLNTPIKLTIQSILISLLYVQTSVAAETINPANGNETKPLQAMVTVYKSPSCGCCKKWVEHIEDNDFSTTIVEMNDLSSVKDKHGVSGRYRSCHTGIVATEVGEYVFEGHVPAEHVQAFLSNPPEGVLGLAVPGMPAGSPGMEVGDRKDYYQVLLLNVDGTSSVFAHVNQ